MNLNASFFKQTLRFKFDAGTSRGILKSKDSYFVKIYREGSTEIIGLGECGPLQGLSIDYKPGLESFLKKTCQEFSNISVPSDIAGAKELVKTRISKDFPSVIFAFETALLDLFQGGERLLFKNDFTAGNDAIDINGLIWMGNREFMLRQINDKLGQGFHCIKIKIGAIDFETECELLSFVRKKYDSKEISIRLDANGAFLPDEAYKKLNILSKYDIQSIEQPVKPGQLELMHILCKESPIPIALDEELIGANTHKQKKDLLEAIRPDYVILKPTLLGGMKACEDWIGLAENMKTGWWITSALESNIGLNAVSQFAASFEPNIPQGLGTGQLFENNIPSPLTIENGKLWYKTTKNWDLNLFQQ